MSKDVVERRQTSFCDILRAHVRCFTDGRAILIITQYSIHVLRICVASHGAFLLYVELF